MVDEFGGYGGDMFGFDPYSHLRPAPPPEPVKVTVTEQQWAAVCYMARLLADHGRRDVLQAMMGIPAFRVFSDTFLFDLARDIETGAEAFDQLRFIEMKNRGG